MIIKILDCLAVLFIVFATVMYFIGGNFSAGFMGVVATVFLLMNIITMKELTRVRKHVIQLQNEILKILMSQFEDSFKEMIESLDNLIKETDKKITKKKAKKVAKKRGRPRKKK